MKNIRSALVCAVLLGALAASSRSFAEPLESWGYALVDIQVGDYTETAATGTGSETSLTFNDGLGRSGLARARTDFGSNHVYAAASNSGDLSTLAFSEAISQWNERFLITGGTGFGEITLNVRLNGTVQNSGATYGPFMYYDVSYSPDAGATNSQVPMSWDIPSELPAGTSSFGPLDLTGTFTFEYGQSFVLYGTMRAVVYDNATVDFFHSATVTSTHIPDGAHIFNDGGPEVLAGFHVNVVPEPETYAMMMLGLGLMIAVARRRKNMPPARAAA